jgi:hypothetical protein
MTQEQMIELARRAVACKGWRWMPGMRTINGRRLAVVFGESRTAAVLCDLRDDANSDTEELQGELPDLTDPATLGCLLSLVREAWGDPRAYMRASFGWEWITDYCVEKWPPGGETEAEALVAALEASPSLKENP